MFMIREDLNVDDIVQDEDVIPVMDDVNVDLENPNPKIDDIHKVGQDLEHQQEIEIAPLKNKDE